MARPDAVLTPGRAGPVVVARDVPASRKRLVFRRYGIGVARWALFTVDHLVPLELGGSNEVENLWPQPRAQARVKDRDEGRLAAEVRRGELSLWQAQAEILRLWGAAP